MPADPTRAHTHAHNPAGATMAAVRPATVAAGSGYSAVTRARWLGPAEAPLMGWLSSPADRQGSTGVLVLPPIGYEYWSSHRTLRVVAERLAAAGNSVLRLDYHATGDSSGDQWAPDRLAAWRASVWEGATELRRLGCRRLVVVGTRLGGTFALLEGGALEADVVVAWSPVAGRRYARAIRLMSMSVPADLDPERREDTLVAAGTVFSAQTLADLTALDLRRTSAAPAPRVLLIGDDEDPDLASHLQSLGCEVEQARLSGEEALERPAEYATVPEAIVDAISRAVGSSEPIAGSGESARTSAEIVLGTATVREEVVELGASRLIGVATRPPAGSDPAATIVFLNAGSEPHIGPGRAWVEYARALAARGHTAVRVDFRGWGESPDDGHAPGRPYDAHCHRDTVDVVRALRDAGHGRVVLAGLCASAWVALRVALDADLDGVVALNPQMYWRPGDPVEALMSETRARRAPQRAREQAGARWGLWSALDAVGHRPWAGRWLDELHDSGTPVLMVFAAGDDGIEYLRNRLSRRLRHVLGGGVVEAVEIAEIDHSMHRAWLRGAVVEAIDGYLRRVAG